VEERVRLASLNVNCDVSPGGERPKQGEREDGRLHTAVPLRVVSMPAPARAPNPNPDPKDLTP